MTVIDSDRKEFCIRSAKKEDAPLIVKYIRKLADFENELDDVSVTKEDIEKNVFDNENATVIIGEYDGKPVGFCLYHYTFSTFQGKKGIGVVDLYIEPHMRNHGYGTAMMKFVAGLAVSQGAGRFEWPVHDWNDKAIELYKRWGAFPIDNIRTYRLHEEALEKFAHHGSEVNP